MSQLPGNEESIFLAALERATPAEREAFVDDACAKDAELRLRVMALLKAHDESRGPFDAPSPSVQGTLISPEICAVGDLIGPYRLLQQIGEGGMGTVYMAEQFHRVKRKVALKLIKAGMDSRQVIARFEAERQALAMMDHVNIARVLDAGTTHGGRPFFVMELVHGVPITKYCDDSHLTPRERLELFVPVCHAIQHAHQKGIIHRDIKPTNVMVTLYDGKPVPKVIDFGVAKATEQALTERTLFTQYGTMVGTLEYMSPEQAEMSGLGVDTRSDIYSLGVLLYELLTGSTPLSQKQLRGAAYGEILRMIKEMEPPKPSTRLSDSGEALASISAHRQMEPAKLTKLVRGELDWIVMKMLEKDRNRRYETANGIAADVQRYLNDEPVLACPPSPAYRFHKFARKYRAVLAVVGVVVVALLLGVVGTTWQAIRATQEPDRAVTAEGLAHSRLVSVSLARAAEAEQRREAERQREHAEGQRQQAVAQQEIARQKELTARQNLYTARITLVEQNLEKAEVGYALGLLERERPASDLEDLRNFEWYHLWWRCHQGHRLTLRGHAGSVMSVTFTPDGTTLASGSTDGTVKLWDVATGHPRMTLLGHADRVNSVSFSPDGKTLASGSTDGTVRLWDCTTGAEQGTIRGHTEAIVAVAFSPDGEILATSSEKATTRLWEVSSKRELASFSTTLHVLAPQTLVFFPDGKTLAIGTLAGVQLFDVPTGRMRTTVGGDRLGMSSVALSSDARTLATSGAEGVKLFDVETSQERPGLKEGAPYTSCVTFSRDAKTIGLGTSFGKVILWDPHSGNKRVYAHRAPVRSVAFSPDGKTLASASDDRTVKLWDVSTQTPPSTLPIISGHLWCVAFSPDGMTAAFAGDAGSVTLWDTATMQEQVILQGHEGPVISVAFAPDGKTLATCGDDSTIRLWSRSTRQEVALLRGHAGPVYSVTFSPDGETLASGSNDRTVKLWDVSTKQERAMLQGHTKWIWAVAFSPDGKTVASGSDDSTIKLWDAVTGRERLTLRGHLGKVRSVLFSHDGRTLYSTDFATIRTWDAATGQERGSLRTIEGLAPLNRAVPLADGHSLAICSQAALKLWDVATGRERATLSAHTGSISSVAIAPDGRMLATTSSDGSGKFWRAATEQDVLNQSSAVDLQDKQVPNYTQRWQELLQEREAHFDKHVQRWPDDPLAWADRGRFFVSSGQLNRAAEDFQQAIERGLSSVNTLEYIVQFFRLHGTREQTLGALSNVIERAPDNMRLRLERGRMRAEQGQTDLAAADFDRALALIPESANPWYVDRGGIDSEIVHSEELCDHVARLRPADVQLRIARVNHYARRREWQKAAAVSSEVIALAPSDHLAWHHDSVLKVQVGDIEGYRRTCREMLTRFNQSDIPNVVERTVKTCLLLPDSVEDRILLLKLADQAVTGTDAHPDHKSFAIARGMADYRQGHFENALPWFRKSITTDSPGGYLVPFARLFVAMTDHQLGRFDEARQSLDTADEQMAPSEEGLLGVDWDDWLRYQIVHREAAAMVKGVAQDPLKQTGP